MTMRVHHTEAPNAQRNDWRTVRSLLPYLWAYRGRAAMAIGFLILSKLANVGVPVALKGIVDALDTPEGRQIALPIALLVAYGLLRLGSSSFNELRDMVFARVRHGVMRRLSLMVLGHLHRLGLRYHLERKTGAISRDLERGTKAASSMMNYMLFSILPTFIEVTLIAGILLINYSVWFAVITFVTVLLYVGFTFKVTEWRMRFRHQMNALDSQANSQAVDGLLNFETVKYFNNEDFEHRRYSQTLGDWEEAAVKTQTSMSGLNVGQGMIIAIGVTAIMTMAAQGVMAGTMSLGDLVMVNAFMLQMFIPLNFLGVVYSQLKHALADMDQMFRLLGEKPEIRDTPDARPLEVADGSVRFEHVDFSYSSDRTILHDVDFEIPPGKKVAVVGHSGAGKSTLSRLLFRFYDATGGRVLVNGQDVREVTQASLRDAIGIVPQDTVLFNDTIYYNIAYGDPNASEEAIIRAARLAQIHDFIESLPEGYDTLVGERGLKLSGGEKQRVAIARTMVKDPKILVFDEATSSLDSASEQAILAALHRVAAERTTLVIAHRLSTVVDADQILVMDQGRIIERGSHRQLLERNGQYAHMWTLQLKQQEAKREQETDPAAAATIVGSGRY
ncbi:ABCB family ABC transporter ATP-binding protein/permease [Thiohalomonas denitrificans]|uniref:ATP-binding cassette, subfamily B n=1 Tax=Thiohalomonas denitrificans TaxID=415747 RepID=A0A1G5PKZ6_9GAMM|nr:ABC transporter ATP-binding protein/permease [Thiohalomonas denitrificans]SCZ50172.1 ATP-binding cassette, subfamily B [Thiohalomonas denitrificans]